GGRRRPPLPVQDPRDGEARRRGHPLCADAGGDSGAGARDSSDSRPHRSPQREGGSDRDDRGAEGGSRAGGIADDWVRVARARRSDRRGAQGRRRSGAGSVAVRREPGRHPDIGNLTVSIALADIVAAAGRIWGAIETPVRLSTWLSAPAGVVQLKLETIQPTSSYKIRGAWNACARLHERHGVDGVRLVTASAGNHGQALACAARHFQFPLTVFVSGEAPRTKLDAIRDWGADLQQCLDYEESERQAKAFATSQGATYISPYSHPDVIAGAGTIGLELYEQQPLLDAVVVPIGGGGLISGIGIAIKSVSPTTRVIGVEVAASCPFTKSLEAGRLVPHDGHTSIADGLTGNLDPETITLDIVRAVVDDIAVVDEDEIRDALASVVENENLIVEGAAATGPAAIVGQKMRLTGNVAVILTGANIDTDRLLDVVRRSPRLSRYQTPTAVAAAATSA